VLKIVENLLEVVLRQEPRWESSQRSPDHLAGVEGLLPTPQEIYRNLRPKNPTSALGRQPFGLGPNEQSWAQIVGTLLIPSVARGRDFVTMKKNHQQHHRSSSSLCYCSDHYA